MSESQVKTNSCNSKIISDDSKNVILNFFIKFFDENVQKPKEAYYEKEDVMWNEEIFLCLASRGNDEPKKSDKKDTKCITM